MGEFIEFSGKTTEEALSRAQEHFNAPLSSLEFEVISPGSGGLFGLLGAKKARIRARVQAGASIAEQMAELAAVVSNGHPARSTPAPPEPAPPPSAAAPAAAP
ncbi:MAG: Jag N-terminal domain-containing protein, partial [Desulfarculus sp.]|nr:Jag N-terminal domain-containing protein [Desulfarculus sp.]